MMSRERLDAIRLEIQKKWGQQPPIWVTDLYAEVDPGLSCADIPIRHNGLCLCERCEAEYQKSLIHKGDFAH